MTVCRSGWLALALACCGGCLRFGYEPVSERHKARDAGVMYVHDAAVSGGGGAGKAGEAGQPSAGASAGMGGAAAGADAGAASDPELGDTGLHVSDILGFYSGDWGDMVLQRRDAEIWGVYRYSDGTIIGAIESEGVFAGWWSQLPTRSGTNAGEVEFRWTRSDTGVVSLNGRWRYGTSGAWLENWDVDLVKDRTAPSELLEALGDTDDFRRHP